MLQAELAKASSIARQAGRLLMEIYETEFRVRYKSETDPVTEADMRANAYICAALSEAFPGDGIVAEENLDHSDALRKGRCWYVDPVDGTREFVAKNGEFAVMLGLAIDGEARLGVVFRPVQDKLYAGIVDQGAYLETQGHRSKLNVSDVSEPSELALVVSRSHRGRRIDELVSQLGITKISKSGSVGLKVGLIAEQRADVYAHLSDKSSAWDACAPEAILRAAGGRFTDLAGKPYHYGGTDLRNRGGILACNAAAYDTVLPIASALGREAGLID